MRFYLNGELLDAEDASVSVLDHGFTVGDGCFETLKLVGGPDGARVPFALTRHLARLAKSAATLGLACPSEQELREAVSAVLAAADDGLGDHGRMRLTVTSGAGPAGSDRGPNAPTLSVTVSPGSPWPDTTSVAVVPWQRNLHSPLVGVKSTSYAENVLALAHAKSLGASEALVGNTDGNLCEGTGSNIFIVTGGEILTPDLGSGPLAGVTRALVCEAVEVVERPIQMDLLERADEAFLTSSTRDVHPVTRMLWTDGAELIGERELEVGPLTRQAQVAFAALQAEGLDP